MSTTTATARPAVVRTQLIAMLGIVLSAVLTAVGTWWDISDSSSGTHAGGKYAATLGIIAVVAALAYGLVVRRAATGRPGRRSAIIGGLGLVSLVVFWTGAPVVLASAAVATALIERDKLCSFGTWSKAGLGLPAVTTAAAMVLAVIG